MSAICAVFDVNRQATYDFAKNVMYAVSTTLGPQATNVVRVLVGNTPGDGEGGGGGGGGGGAAGGGGGRVVSTEAARRYAASTIR